MAKENSPEAEAETKGEGPKQQRICYLCAERCDVVGFEEKHVKKCRKLWLRERGYPEEAIEKAPKDPADTCDAIDPNDPEYLLGGPNRRKQEDNKKLGNDDLRTRLDALSMRVWKQKSLKRCPNCFRTFKLDAFEKHKLGCFAKKGVHWMPVPGGEGGRYASGPGAGLNTYKFPGQREGTTVPIENLSQEPGWTLTEFAFVKALVPGQQAERLGVKVGYKIIAICGHAVINRKEVEEEWRIARAEWAKSMLDPELHDAYASTYNFTFKQVLQFEQNTVVFDLNRDLGMSLTEGGVIEDIHLDTLKEKCQAELAGLTCGRKIDQVGSTFAAPVDGELQVEDIQPTNVRNRKEFENAVEHRKQRYRDLKRNGPLWCRVRFCAMGKIDPSKPLGISCFKRGRYAVVRAVDPRGQVANRVPLLQVGCRLESLSGSCVTGPDDIRKLLVELRNQSETETNINFSPPLHLVPPDEDRVNKLHVSYIKSGPLPLEDKQDRGDDTIRYGTFWGDTTRANALVGERVLIDPVVVENMLRQTAELPTGENVPSQRNGKKKKSPSRIPA